MHYSEHCIDHILTATMHVNEESTRIRLIGYSALAW